MFFCCCYDTWKELVVLLHSAAFALPSKMNTICISVFLRVRTIMDPKHRSPRIRLQLPAISAIKRDVAEHIYQQPAIGGMIQ